MPQVVAYCTVQVKVHTQIISLIILGVQRSLAGLLRGQVSHVSPGSTMEIQ